MLRSLKLSLALIALVILVLLAIPLFINTDDYKPEISRIVYQVTGRNIEIENIKLSFFPWVGITLENIGLENTPGFKQPHILTVRAIDIQLELIPLLNNKIEVKRFELDTPKIWVSKHLDQSNNWFKQSLPQGDVYANAPEPQTTDQPDAASKPIALSLQHELMLKGQSKVTFNADRLQLHHGQIFFSDENVGSIEINDIQLDIDDFQLKQPFEFNLSGSLAGDTFNIHSAIGPIGDLKEFKLAKLPILAHMQSEGFSLFPLSPWLPDTELLSEQFGNLQHSKIDMDLSLEQHADSNILCSGTFRAKAKSVMTGSWKTNSKDMQSINIQELKLSLDDTHILALTGKLKDIWQNPRFEIRLETAKLQRIWLNQYIPALQQLFSNHPAPWQSVKLGTLIAGDSDILEIRDLQLLLDDDPLQASGNLALGSDPDAQLRISANTLNIDSWIPKPEVVQSGSADNQAVEAGEPNLTFLKPWYLSVQFSARSVILNQLKLDNVRMALSAENGVVRLNPLRFEIDEGQISENFTLYAHQYPATWKESIKMSGVSLSPILGATFQFNQLSGIAQLNTELSGTGLSANNFTRNLNGRGHFVFEDGQFKGVDIENEVHQQANEHSSSNNSTNFSQMQGSFTIHKGVLMTNDLYMASPSFRLTGKGKLRLKPLRLDYHIRPRLIDTLSNHNGAQSHQGVVVPLHITGPVSNLKVTFETEDNATMDRQPALDELLTPETTPAEPEKQNTEEFIPDEESIL